jgi:hypothetical protein
MVFVSMCCFTLLADLLTQAVVDNNDTLQQYIAQTAQRLEIMDTALQQAESEAAKVRIQVFARYIPSELRLYFYELTACRKIAAEAAVLVEMLSRSIVVKILESEEDKKTIADIFKQIEAHTKDFHVCVFAYPQCCSFAHSVLTA